MPPVLPHEQFWNVSTPREARQRLLQSLRLETLGPNAPDEVLSESPLNRYIVGALAPFGTDVLVEEQDEELTATDDEEESGTSDASPPLSQSITPSSIGLSFLLPESASQISVEARWGEYHAEEYEEPRTESPRSDEEIDGDETQHPDDEELQGPSSSTTPASRRRARYRWIRSAQEPRLLLVELKPNAGLRSTALGDGINVEHVSRRIGDRLAVSLFLVNRRISPRDARPPVDSWIFQPSLRICGTPIGGAFLPRELEPSLVLGDSDRESNRLLFRSRREFAVGHGCAAEWSTPDASGRVSEIRTELFPCYELPKVQPRRIDGAALDMHALGSASAPPQLKDMLLPLLTAYEQWIDEKRSVILALEKELQPVAREHLRECETALARMARGVDAVTSDEDAFQAFRFANRAMLLQRSHTTWARERRREPSTAPSEPMLEGTWRPFQLAFMLLNLAGLIDPEAEDRAIGDLLWFPTGGGKTEAYLGLTAFTIALRRRRNIGGMRTDAGVTVLMRYTLRLLTIQQFQRAATLICACEKLRREDVRQWGAYRFSLGLWVGRKGTPNRHDDSRHALMRLQQNPAEEGASPCVLDSCPWCGAAIGSNQYWIDGERVRTRVACPRMGCLFSREQNEAGIPILTVDEEIYRECPAMVIATVDKFAQMPWNAEVQSLFGFVDRECDRCGFLGTGTNHPDAHRAPGTRRATSDVRPTERLAPPELVIQDELHLISGPLGTLVGLYETAVDFLCQRRARHGIVKAKVVASTATVRRAFEQVQSIFDRTLKVFPPPGLDPDDSFFGIEQSVDDATPGRLYVGLCAPGKSMKTAYVRIAASLLSSAAGLGETPALAEPYMTLVSYFNSLRELGGARRLMDDDIPGRLYQLSVRGAPRRRRPSYEELTSRVRQDSIPRLLSRLEERHDADGASRTTAPLDAVLASNMISVGVDIDRLGLMTVTGQPKTTAEYIQATSRVGRQPWGPGLVVTIYNWSRPRDLSHYERFRHYHATLYRNVEAVSATPFSSRAQDRGLRGAYVSMVRLGSEAWAPDLGASLFDPRARRVEEIIAFISRRAEVTVDQETAGELKTVLRALGDQWWAYRSHPLRYGWQMLNATASPLDNVLLRVPETRGPGYWPAPQSLREVEDVSQVRVLGLYGR